MSGDGFAYQMRVNRVIDHIRAHLGDTLTLADLAGVAAFSPFHFHRVFKAATGETLFGFIQRVRLERAAVALLSHRRESVLATASQANRLARPAKHAAAGPSTLGA